MQSVCACSNSLCFASFKMDLALNVGKNEKGRVASPGSVHFSRALDKSEYSVIIRDSFC